MVVMPWFISRKKREKEHMYICDVIDTFIPVILVTWCKSVKMNKEELQYIIYLNNAEYCLSPGPDKVLYSVSS